jgi:hypothetical protein
LPADGAVVLVSPDGQLAHFAAAEYAADTRIRVLAGGFRAWQQAALGEEVGERFYHSPEDFWRRPDDGTNTPAGKMRGYLAWEIALPALVQQDGDVRFRIVP